MIPNYPDSCSLSLELRPELHTRFQALEEGISELTFANFYLYRAKYGYAVSRLEEEQYLFTGRDSKGSCCQLPVGLPEPGRLLELFHQWKRMKTVSEPQAARLEDLGCTVDEDRDNFDYLYLRSDLAELKGKRYHKKRNLVNAFLNNYTYEGRPLTEDHKEDAFAVLRTWRSERQKPGDYTAAEEALRLSEQLELRGGLFYVDGKAAAYALGEETARGRMFVIKFEKAIGGYKGLYQFVNKCFAAILPEKYEYINREQDLGDDGLRQAKMTYRPAKFVKKFQAIVSRLQPTT